MENATHAAILVNGKSFIVLAPQKTPAPSVVFCVLHPAPLSTTAM
jgi:hypothetical protein